MTLKNLYECRIDFETRSDVDLGNRGLEVYFNSPHFRPICAAYSIKGDSMNLWEWGDPMPKDLRHHVETGGTIRAWNAAFERHCFDRLAEMAGWAKPVLEQYRCTQAEASAMGLPRSLAEAAKALGLAVNKDLRGKSLIDKFSKPRAPKRWKGEESGVIYFNEKWDFPDDHKAFLEYCKQDVIVEAAIARKIMPLSEQEIKVYQLDQIINSRGIPIDIQSAFAALEMLEKEEARLNHRLKDLTQGFCDKGTQVARILKWVETQGVEIEDLSRPVLSKALEELDLEPRTREVLEIRQKLSKTSTKKLVSMIQRAGKDGRVRNSFSYYGTNTGRWASRGVNFANLPRPRKIFEDAHLDPEDIFDSIRQKDAPLLQLLYGDELGTPNHFISDILRGFICAPEGKKFLQADYSSIENAVIAWSSGEEWKVQEMHKINADPSIPDLYRQTASKITGIPLDILTKKHPARQSVGKVSELAFGFGGGVAAFKSMAAMYKVDLAELSKSILQSADEVDYAKAKEAFERYVVTKKESTAYLSEDEWITCELIKVGWRRANSKIVEGWRLREDAVIAAIKNPGQIFEALKFKYLCDRGFLWVRLPSKRCLVYGRPKLTENIWVRRKSLRMVDGQACEVEVDECIGVEVAELIKQTRPHTIEILGGKARPSIWALRVNSTTSRWEEFALYGGLLAENDTQAIARDLLVNGMLKAEGKGFPVIAHVYDEIICEVDENFDDLRGFEKLICELPNWAEGLPLSAGGWMAKRYKKE